MRGSGAPAMPSLRADELDRRLRQVLHSVQHGARASSQERLMERGLDAGVVGTSTSSLPMPENEVADAGKIGHRLCVSVGRQLRARQKTCNLYFASGHAGGWRWSRVLRFQTEEVRYCSSCARDGVRL